MTDLQPVLRVKRADDDPAALRRVHVLAVATLALLAALFLVWPVWRATLPLEIWGNEGWNAYHADAAAHGGLLYPPPDGLVANNYPPLSFLLIGGLGRLFGDPLYIGRVLSLAAVLALGCAVAAMVRSFGGRVAGAAVGGLWFVATMARFFDFYVGMNEPQLLAQAIMAAGFVWFLTRMAAGRAVEPAVLVMVAAGFFKHNIVVMPAAALIWLALHDRRRALRAALVGSAAAALGLVLCAVAFAPDFVADMLMPRGYYVERTLKALGRLQFVLPGLAIWSVWAWSERTGKAARFTALMIGLSLASYLAQKSGAGVDENAQFELVFATAVGVGLAFERLPFGELRARWPAAAIALAILAVLAIRLLASTRAEFALVLASPGYRALAAEHAAVAHAEAARVAAIPSPVACSNLVVCRAAGKPFVYDHFKVQQMLETGLATPAGIEAIVRRQGIVRDTTDPRAGAASLFRRYPRD
jgi:hypothetical protein